MDTLIKIRENVVMGEVDVVKDLVQQAIDEKQEAKAILKEGLIEGIHIVGNKYETGEFFLPEMVIAAKAMKEGLKVLSPIMKQGDRESSGTVILGAAKGDIHDIGKGIVGTMLEGAGFIVIDLGEDVDTETFIAAAKEHDADIIGISALLTTTMVWMEDVVSNVKEEGLKTKVMIGGASVNQNFADQIKAHGYAPDAATAVVKAKELMEK